MQQGGWGDLHHEFRLKTIVWVVFRQAVLLVEPHDLRQWILGLHQHNLVLLFFLLTL